MDIGGVFESIRSFLDMFLSTILVYTVGAGGGVGIVGEEPPVPVDTFLPQTEEIVDLVPSEILPLVVPGLQSDNTAPQAAASKPSERIDSETLRLPSTEPGQVLLVE